MSYTFKNNIAKYFLSILLYAMVTSISIVILDRLILKTNKVKVVYRDRNTTKIEYRDRNITKEIKVEVPVIKYVDKIIYRDRNVTKIIYKNNCSCNEIDETKIKNILKDLK